MITNILHTALIAITNNYDDTFDWYTPLTFTAEEPDSAIKLTQTGSPSITGLQYRTNKTSDWSTYTIGTEITLAAVDDYVQFQNTNKELSTEYFDYVQFVMSGKIAASGNIQSMLNYSYSCTDYCYSHMFYNCTSLTSAPELPATNLAADCYMYMFFGCSSLTSAPELPATNLTLGCYGSMFNGCTSLIAAPSILPATNLAQGCYSGMFQNCKSLTTAPELPATTLAIGCYQSMFYGCTSLTEAPELPATNLAESCYKSMFELCISLTETPELPAKILADGCYYYMFQDCRSLTDIKVEFTSWSTTARNNRWWN